MATQMKCYCKHPLHLRQLFVALVALFMYSQLGVLDQLPGLVSACREARGPPGDPHKASKHT